jgi:hypothetical protein
MATIVAKHRDHPGSLMRFGLSVCLQANSQALHHTNAILSPHGAFNREPIRDAFE